MNKQAQYDRAYLAMAKTWGDLSYCERKKVGALIVKDRVLKMSVKMKTIILNGMCYMPRQTPFLK